MATARSDGGSPAHAHSAHVEPIRCTRASSVARRRDATVDAAMPPSSFRAQYAAPLVSARRPSRSRNMARATRSGPPGKQASSTCPLVLRYTPTSSSPSATPSSSNQWASRRGCISPRAKVTPPAARTSRSSSPTHGVARARPRYRRVGSLAERARRARGRAARRAARRSSVKRSAPPGPMSTEPPDVGPARSRMPSTVRWSGKRARSERPTPPRCRRATPWPRVRSRRACRSIVAERGRRRRRASAGTSPTMVMSPTRRPDPDRWPRPRTSRCSSTSGATNATAVDWLLARRPSIVTGPSSSSITGHGLVAPSSTS